MPRFLSGAATCWAGKADRNQGFGRAAPKRRTVSAGSLRSCSIRSSGGAHATARRTSTLSPSLTSSSADRRADIELHHHRVHPHHRTRLVREILDGLVADRHLSRTAGGCRQPAQSLRARCTGARSPQLHRRTVNRRRLGNRARSGRARASATPARSAPGVRNASSRRSSFESHRTGRGAQAGSCRSDPAGSARKSNGNRVTVGRAPESERRRRLARRFYAPYGARVPS